MVNQFNISAIKMAGIPQLVSLLFALGGLSAFIISLNAFFNGSFIKITSTAITVIIMGIVLGGTSFAGSIIAFYKLSGKLKVKNPMILKKSSKMLLITLFILSISIVVTPSFTITSKVIISIITLLSLVYGVLFALPIRKTDVPILMSILIAVTGLATIFSGIIFNNFIIIVGAVLVGLTGIVLTIRMYKYMDCSLVAVLSGYTINSTKAKKTNSTNEMQRITAVETAQLLAASKKVAIVPGFGMAVAQAQHICYELQKNLMRLGTHFTYIIHPVAGRMPGHMNVLLAEANIDYTYIKDMDDVNDAMNQFDMAIIIGANDIVNPAAETDERSVIYGMPIIKAYQAKQVVVIKRGMATGYSGVRNLLLEKNNCKILFGDAKESLTKIINELKKI